MKNTYIFLAVLAFLMLAGTTFATIAYPYYGGHDYTTKAYYSAVFDERGLASVMLRLDYTNIDKNNASDITINIPGNDVKLIGVFVKSECVPPSIYIEGQPDYAACNYYNYKFEPANVTKISEGVYRILLPQSLAKGEQTQLLVYYRAFGYVKDGIATKDFDFQTAKFDFDVDSTRVAINVDNDLYLKEGESSADYRNTFSTGFAAAESKGVAAQSALSSSYDYVSYAQGYIKEKSILLAGEVFHVGGSYTKIKLLLYLPEILVTLALICGAGYFVYKWKPKGWKPKGQPVQNKAKEIKSRVIARESGSSSLLDAAIYAFIAAIVFSIAASLILILVMRTGSSFFFFGEERLFLLSLVAFWVLSAAFVYKIRPDHKVASVIMFLGFTIIMMPFMMGIFAMLVYILFPPYYYSGGPVPMAVD